MFTARTKAYAPLAAFVILSAKMYRNLSIYTYLCRLTLAIFDMYPEELVKPMRAELADAGFEELYSADAVETALAQPGTTLVVVNSVCGCAARNARPGAKMSLEGAKKPDRLVTVFAGVDREAVDDVERLAAAGDRYIRSGARG